MHKSRYVDLASRSISQSRSTVFVGQWMERDSLPPCFLKTLLLGTEVNTHTHGLKGKARKPPKKHIARKGNRSKSNPQTETEKEKKKGHPRNRNPYVFPGLQNLLARKGQEEGMPSLRSQEGLATPGARLQPILNRKKKKRKKKPIGAIGRWPRGWPQRQLVTGRGQVGSQRVQAV